MKHILLAATLTITPITGYTLDKDLCEAVKSIASLCTIMRKSNIKEEDALRMFTRFNNNTQAVAKIVCHTVYELESIELLSDEGIANTFYKNCLEK